MPSVETAVLDRMAAVGYVLGRRTPQGGYCFYRTPEWKVEEPNAPDTLAALQSLRLLGVDPPDPDATATWLQQLQHTEGDYPTRVIGWAAITGLGLLGRSPLRSPERWLADWVAALARRRHRDLRDGLQDASRLVDLLTMTGPVTDPSTRRALWRLLDNARDRHGGWTRPEADLETTAVAVRLQTAGLGTPVDGTTVAFARRCEDAALGFRIRPDAAATSVGALLGGLRVLESATAGPTHPAAIGLGLRALQRADGGLSARHRAISTLRATWQGLEAARLLEHTKEHP